MNMRPKTKRRLIILCIGMLVVTAGVAVFIVIRNRQMAQQLVEYRQQGLAAFKAGDYSDALQLLSKYNGKRKNNPDPETLLAFGKVRSRIELPDGRHLFEAVDYFRRYLDLRPGDPEVEHLLLDLYPKVNYNVEAVVLADAVLAKAPADTTALKAKAIALVRQGQLDKALPVAEKWNEIDPLDLEGQGVTYDVLAELKRPADELIARAAKLRAAHPEDPRFELLQGYAYRYAAGLGDSPAVRQEMLDKAIESLRSAARRKAPNAVFIRQLVFLFDSLNLFRDADQVLVQATAQDHDRQVTQLLAQRLWQSGRHEQVIELLKDLSPQSADSDSRLLTFRALALYQLNRRDEAKPILAALESRKDDDVAGAWAVTLRTAYEEKGLDPKTAITQYRSALRRDPRDPIIMFLLGEAYTRLGETELALQSWRDAAEAAPSWAQPHALMARILMARGQADQAAREAQLAAQRAPTVGSIIGLALARFAQLDPKDAAAVAELRKLVDQIRQTSPDEPEILPVYATLLAREGKRDAAAAAIRLSLDAAKPPALDVLMRLALASRSLHLGLEPAILEFAEKVYHLTPEVARFRASEMAAANKPHEGLEYLQKAAKEASGPPLAWQLAIARYRESIGDPQAGQAWVELGDANPKELRVQDTILDTRSAWERPRVHRTDHRATAGHHR